MTAVLTPTPGTEGKTSARGWASRRAWFTVSEVAEMLGYGETKVRMLVIQGDLRSLTDGRSRRIQPQRVDEYVRRRAEDAA